MMRFIPLLFATAYLLHAGDGDLARAAAPEQGKLPLRPDAKAQWQFGAPLAERIERNRAHWLIECPRANPGLLEMFAVRDRQPAPQLVPWAGEFVGKYLISAIQALRMSNDPELARTTANVIAQLIASQADDGYLGPFPRDQRLLGHWDLWGHYHVTLALLMWHERTGDAAALAASRRAADLMTRTYLGTPRRVIDAGSHEMNMAVVHSLGWLYRLTGEEKYRQLMAEIETDWEKSGDYFRTGLAGVEFYRTPRPRWESLHDLQGMVELFRITGDERYRRSFLHHWGSIRRWDRHNTGGFSSGEQATGNPYENQAIETCCTIAWMALSIDALALTHDPIVADELELATFNGMLGAQHPSGRWWTYNTPMDGAREASAHSIVFQSRAGTPELNCCSVNAPRGLGMLSEWAVMQTDQGLAVNYYGPLSTRVHLADGTPIELEQTTRYPLEGAVTLAIKAPAERRFLLELRIPAWSKHSTARLNGQALPQPTPGSYLQLDRTWRPDDRLELTFDMTPRVEAGDLQALGKASIYRGPLLLAYDQALNDFDEQQIPTLEAAKLPAAEPIELPGNDDSVTGFLRPWLVLELPTVDGRAVRVCDFASAGARGTRYRSWLAVDRLPPPAPVAWQPADGSRLPKGRLLFTWRRPPANTERTHQLVVAETPDFAQPVVTFGNESGDRLILPAAETTQLEPGKTYYWKLVARNAHGTTESLTPYKQFVIDESLPELDERSFAQPGAGPDGVLTVAALAGDAKPRFGKLVDARAVQPAAGPTDKEQTALEFDGRGSRVIYALERFPESDYSVSLWVRPPAAASRKLVQLFSAWHAPMDDPLRVCLQNGQVSARIEAGGGFATPTTPLGGDAWHHVAAVKDGTRLSLFVDGQPRGTTTVPAAIYSSAVDFALGANPHYTGDEYFAGRLALLKFYARVLTSDEIEKLAQEKGQP